jgi:hypothetical protein
LQNQKKPSQLGKLIILIKKKMTHKGENYSVKMQKYYFCNGTSFVCPCFNPLYTRDVVVLNPVESTMKSVSNPTTDNADKKTNLRKI